MKYDALTGKLVPGSTWGTMGIAPGAIWGFHFFTTDTEGNLYVGEDMAYLCNRPADMTPYNFGILGYEWDGNFTGQVIHKLTRTHVLTGDKKTLELAGKLVKGHPGYSGTIMTATHQIARELGWSYFEKLAKQKVLQVQSATEPPKRLEAGERGVAVTAATTCSGWPRSAACRSRSCWRSRARRRSAIRWASSSRRPIPTRRG